MDLDLVRAKEMLDEGYTLVLCRQEAVYTSKLRGVGALLEYVDQQISLENFASADKVVGKGAAFLYVLLGVKSVYAKVISQSALEILQRDGIAVSYATLVERIINRKGDGFCPIESAVLDCDEPQKALVLMKERLKSL